MQDPDVAHASCWAAWPALALLLAHHSSPAERPDHTSHAALVAHGGEPQPEQQAQRRSQSWSFYVEGCFEDSAFPQ